MGSASGLMKGFKLQMSLVKAVGNRHSGTTLFPVPHDPEQCFLRILSMGIKHRAKFEEDHYSSDGQENRYTTNNNKSSIY